VFTLAAADKKRFGSRAIRLPQEVCPRSVCTLVMDAGLVALWLAALLGLGLVGLPLSTWLFAGGRPAALSVPVALAVVGVVGHLVGQIAFGWPALATGLLALVGLSAVAARRVAVDLWTFGWTAALFAGAFLVVVGLRAADPAAAPLPVAIGEKFLDFGMLKTLERTGSLPPEDVWFAGEPVRYYYGGHLVAALLSRLTGTAPRFAYNLALAGVYAALFVAAAGVAAAIAPARERLAAGFGAFFVGVAGNLETAARVVVWLLPGPVDGWLADAAGVPGAVEWTPGRFFYFDASRVLPVDPRVAEPARAATEFPLFAWLNGDLHAHMMSQPFLLLAVALLVAYWRDPGRRRLLLLGALPPVAGLIGFTNVWSLPTVGGLTALTVALAPGDPGALLPGERSPGPQSGATGELRRVGFGVGAAALVTVLGVGWTFPFWLGGLPGSPGTVPALWGGRTPLGPLVLVHGGFLAVIAAAFVLSLGTVDGDDRIASRIEAVGPLGVAAGLFAVLVVCVALGFPALGLAGPLLVGGWWLARREGEFAWLLVVAGAGLVLVVEVATVSGERFNSIFKPYAHVWLVWAVAAATLLAGVVADGPELSVPAGGRVRTARWVLGALVVASTGLYAGFAVPAHLGNPGPAVEAGGPTLDATAYVEVEYPREAPAIRWLDERGGQPTIVTAAPGGYYWRPAEGEGASAPATLSGLPAVLGWFHEAQYRGEAPYERRLADVRAIYTGGPETRRELLSAYDVEYVYVGPAERARYDEVTIGGLSEVEVARSWAAVTVYRVDDG
jgi:YYY domain-containing protein